MSSFGESGLFIDALKRSFKNEAYSHFPQLMLPVISAGGKEHFVTEMLSTFCSTILYPLRYLERYFRTFISAYSLKDPVTKHFPSPLCECSREWMLGAKVSE